MIRSLDRKPAFGLTLGMNDIISSRQLILLATGSNKKEAITQLDEASAQETLDLLRQLGTLQEELGMTEPAPIATQEPGS